MHRNLAWDKVENLNPQSTPQVLPSFEEYTSPVTYPEEVEETLGTPIDVEPLDETPLLDLGFDTCNHDIPLSYREIPKFYEPEAQPQPIPSCPSLDISLGEERGLEPPIKPPSPDSFKMKEVDHLTNHTLPSPRVASFHLRDLYCYYRPCVDDPKKHYGFKPVVSVFDYRLYLMRKSLKVLKKIHWMILGGRFNQLSHVSSSLLSKPGEY
nr:ribonuclease H-like domain-containing protein [Tanacetum cinerariifolium]